MVGASPMSSETKKKEKGGGFWSKLFGKEKEKEKNKDKIKSEKSSTQHNYRPNLVEPKGNYFNKQNE